MIEKVVAQIVAEVDDQSIKQAENDLKTFARDTKKELDKDFLLKLQIDKANLSLELEKAKALLNKAKKENDQASIIDMTIKVDTLKSNLTEAGRQLNNYKNTGDIVTSRLQAKFNQVGTEIEKSRDILGKFQSGLSSVGTAIVGFFAFDTILNGITNIIKKTADLEQTKVVFENITGSVADATKIIDDAKTFAAKTPFSVGDITDAEKKLLSIAGIAKNNLIPTLTKLGDIASSQGKSLEQVVEAFNDAIVGEYERLKEFGIRASSSGDQVTFTFKGQTTTVEKTQEAISNYLLELGKLPGVVGSMEKQSQTLNGQLSTTSDNFTNIGTSIGLNFLPVLNKSLTAINFLISVFITGIKVLGLFVKDGVGVVITGLVVLGETFGNILGIITNNLGIFKDNAVVIFNNFITNFGIAIGNLPAIFGNGLDAMSKKLDEWANKAINLINSVSKKIGGPEIGPIDLKTNLGGSLKGFQSIGGLKSIDTSGVSFKYSTKSLDMLKSSLSDTGKEIDNFGNLFKKTADDIGGDGGGGGNGGGKGIIKATNNLETLRNKLKTAKDELEKLTIGSEAYKKKQKEIADLEKQIDNAEGKKATGSTKKKTDLEEEAQKKQVEMLERNKKYKDKLRDEEEKREEEKNKKLKNNLDALSDAYKEGGDIYGDVIDEAKDKSDEFSDKIKDLQEDIKDLNKDLADLESEKVKTLGERFVETSDKIKDLNKEIKDLKDSGINESIAQSIGLDTLRLIPSDNETGGGKVSDLIKLLELQKELNDLKNEQILIQQNISSEQITEAQRVAGLSETAKYLEEFKIKKQKILDDKALKDQEILNLQTQKDTEAKIIEDFNNKKAQLDENYKNKVASIESQITDKTLLEVNKRLSFLEELRQKAIATAEAMRSAGVSTTTTTINNNPNVVVNANLTNDVDVNNLGNKLADKVSLSKKGID